MRYQSLLKVVTLLATIHASSADDATTISSIGCVAPSAFESCLNDATESETRCALETAGNIDASAGCGLGLLINQMQCYFESCWNKVYSCEYQSLVNQYQNDRDLLVPEDVPFWPAPDNAPGGCSCNLGNLYINFTASSSGIIACPSTVNLTETEECSCCGLSTLLAAYYGICPTTDPDQVDYAGLLEGITGYESTIGINCSEIIASTDCGATWGFFSPYDGQYPDPAVGLPPNGTESLSTIAGSLTSPPGGATFTWSLLGTVQTATAAPYNEKNVAATTSDATTATSTKTGDTTATSGTSKSTSTKATSTDSSNEPSTSSVAATTSAKTSRAVKAQTFSNLEYTLFALLVVMAYIY